MEIVIYNNGNVQNRYNLPVAKVRQLEKYIKDALQEMPIAPQTAKKTAKKIATKTSDPHLLAAIREGLQDVKDMRDGKQPKQTLKELLDEL